VCQLLDHLAKSEKDPVTFLEQTCEVLIFLYDEGLHQAPGEATLSRPPRLLDRLRHAVRLRHYSRGPIPVTWSGRHVTSGLEPTMSYTHVARNGPAGVTSPLDLLAELTPAAIEGAAAARRAMQQGRGLGGAAV
jgi:hypothetical protein